MCEDYTGTVLEGLDPFQRQLKRLKVSSNHCRTLSESDIIFINGNAYSKQKLCLDWFQMSNDCFYETYGFNFNPHKYPGLYAWGRRTLYGE